MRQKTPKQMAAVRRRLDHGDHCRCVMYLRGVLANLLRASCLCGGLPAGETCAPCALIRKALAATRDAARKRKETR